MTHGHIEFHAINAIANRAFGIHDIGLSQGCESLPERFVMMKLRHHQPSDTPALLDLFRDTIRRVNSRDYSPTQIAAWASEDIDPVGWARRFEGRFVMVAEDAGQLIGFAELEADGHIDRFYVSADHQSQGVGRQLVEAIVAEARRLGINRLFLEASITARPFFERHEFRLLASQVVICRGVELANFRMERWLH